ncbi:MAG: glycosyltransferase family A protein [Chthoniobacterales bacterium]
MIRYEWKLMAEAEIYTSETEPSPVGESVAVVVPLFPKLPGLRESLASLATQTRLPNLVVLLDDGTNPEAETLPAEIPGLAVEVVQVETGTLPAAVNAVMEYLENFDFVTFLQAGDFYLPERIERCLAAFEPPGDRRPPALVVTGVQAVDGRGQPLAPDDPRSLHLARLWEPGEAEAGLADWLGAGHFPGPISNIFARRSYFAANPLPEQLSGFNQSAVLLAALQGQMWVEKELLLRHYPPLPEREPTVRTMTENLQVQLAVLSALRDKLAFSPETRRLTAAYHRAAWNSRSGVREDLFQQLVLRLAAAAAPEDGQATLQEILRSYEAQTAPAHWAALLEGGDPLDLTGYADALRRTREKLAAAREELDRLRIIAGAAQGSGWVRFGAWLGERSARRMMELEESEEAAPLKEKTEGES